MIHFSYTGQGETLCGEPQLEADLEDGKLCEDCIKVMWKEQYRRNHLVKHKPEAPKAEAPKEPNFEPSWLYLSHYLEASE
jgi:hypothetical protein